MADGIYTVGELTEEIKSHLETGFPELWLRGEISNFKRHSSGHLYFTLKDGRAQINAIIWRTTASRLHFQLEDGKEILVHGRVEVYALQGRYQIVCDSAKEVGEGDLQQQFQRLLKKLEAEGLFNAEHKKPLPRLPSAIGIITSPTGAVIEDICSVLNRRFPYATLKLFPVRVQGDGAILEIISAINYFNHPKIESHQVDVIILGRGGGSLEDLWAFNDESVARAVFNSNIPIISAVGHQTDFTICDFVADVRAGTPSMAAEVVAPSLQDILGSIESTLRGLMSYLGGDIEMKKSLVREIAGSYVFNRPQRDIHSHLQTVDRFSERLDNVMSQKLISAISKIESLSLRIDALGYRQTLNRGYALVFKEKKLVRSVSDLQTNDELMIRFVDGERRVKIIEQ